MLPPKSRDIIGKQYLPTIKKGLKDFIAVHKLLQEVGGSATFGDCDWAYTIRDVEEMRVIQTRDMAAGWDYAFFLKEHERKLSEPESSNYIYRKVEFHARQIWPYIGSEEKVDELNDLLASLNKVKAPWTLEKINDFLKDKRYLLFDASHSFEYKYKDKYTLNDFLLSMTAPTKAKHPVFWDSRDPGFLFTYKFSAIGEKKKMEIVEDTSDVYLTNQEHILTHLSFALEELKSG